MRRTSAEYAVLRRRAIQMDVQGVAGYIIARSLGVRCQAVYRWLDLPTSEPLPLVRNLFSRISVVPLYHCPCCGYQVIFDPCQICVARLARAAGNTVRSGCQ